jgi:hypothetical protein
LLEDWIEHFNKKHDRFTTDSEPQLGWYLWRAKWNATALPYQFGGLAVPRRQLVNWQLSENRELGRMLQVGNSDQWKRLCNKLLPPTLHNTIGQQLAFLYATERFYLFENLAPEDFDKNKSPELGSLTDRLSEAEAIRDNHGCFERVPYYQDEHEQYASYFKLYTAQLRLIQLDSVHKADLRGSLIEKIGQELEEADHFGTAAGTLTLLLPKDTWDKHRDHLKLLREWLENAKRDSRS